MKRTLVLVLVAACGGAPAKPVANPDGPAPKPVAKPAPTTAEDVIEQSLAAEGGRDRLAKVTSIHMVGSMMIPQLGKSGVLETFSAPPNSAFQRFEVKGLIKQESGVQGDLAWEKNTIQGARILTGAERSNALREAIFNGDLDWKKLYPTVAFEGVVKFADTDCYKVVLTSADGLAQTRYYAKATLLPVGLEMVAPSQMGNLPVKITSSDWREIGGIKYPHKAVHEEAGQQFEVTIEKIEPNFAIPAGTFEPSDEIKQLAAQK